MIVWDSREAEERNARNLLAWRRAEMRKARRKARQASIWGVVSALFVPFNLWNLAFRHGVLPVVGLLVAVAAVATWPAARRAAAERIAWCEEWLQTAQEVHDRVFGGQP